MKEYNTVISSEDLNVLIEKLDGEMSCLIKYAKEHPSKKEYADKLLLDYNLYMSCIELQKSINNDDVYLNKTNLDDVKNILVQNRMLSYINMTENKKGKAR